MKIESIARLTEVRRAVDAEPFDPVQGRATLHGCRLGAPAMSVEVELSLSRDDLAVFFAAGPDRMVKVTIEIV